MKNGIVLHPEYGVNPSIEICIVCGEEMGIALFCIIEGMTRRAGMYVPVLVRFWVSHKQ